MIHRRGIALVEAAACLPVIVIVVFGMLELSNYVYLRQKVTSATYIGMQRLAQKGATDQSVIDTVTTLLQSRGISNATVSISPAGLLGTAGNQTNYTLHVQAPVNENIANPKLIPLSGNVVVEHVLYK